MYPMPALELHGLTQSDRMGLAATLVEYAEVPADRADSDFGGLVGFAGWAPVGDAGRDPSSQGGSRSGGGREKCSG